MWLLLPALLSGAVLIALNAGGSASADDPVQLNGNWAPFNRCPVDDPTMLAVQGPANTGYCAAVRSTGGTIKLGNATSTTGDSNVQFGLSGPAGGINFDVTSPAGGAIIAAPVDVPGGLLGLMCPSTNAVVAAVCGQVTNNDLNRVSATVQQAGAPSGFNLAAGLATGVAIVTLPIKVKLDNPLLGATCFIGSDADPIVLKPANLTRPSLQIERFNTDGTPNSTGPLQLLKSSGGTQGDSTFAVPGASGCGLGGVLDTAINLKEGLPSASGNNSLILSDASSYTARFYPPRANSGQLLSDAWRSAVCTGTCPVGGPVTIPTSTPTSGGTATVRFCLVFCGVITFSY